MKTKMNLWIFLVVVSAISINSAFGQFGNNEQPINSIRIAFPTNWTLNQKDGTTTSISPDRNAQIIVTNTKYSEIKMVYDYILNSYFQKTFTNLVKTKSESEESDGLIRTMITYKAIAKSDKKPVFLITQFAILSDNDNAKTILYIGIVRQSAGRQFLDLVNQSFRTIEIENNSENLVTPTTAQPTEAKPNPPTQTNLPKPSTSTSAQTTGIRCPGSKLTDTEIISILKQHNDERAAVGVPPLKWDCTLANYAQNWANQGIFEHSNDEQLSNIFPGTMVGENLQVDSETSNPPGVFDWLEEKPFWNNATATCKNGEICGHYTQMVWRSTTHVGCGINRNTPGEFKTLFVCNYSPAGNEPGPAY